ncbi:hypothetical protein AAHH78_39305, partial [Burkholderia pseudomallei]
FDALGLDPDDKTRGRAALAGLGKALVEVIADARGGGNPLVAQIVAAECVVLAETKEHLNWELMGLDFVVPDEDHHLYHT